MFNIKRLNAVMVISALFLLGIPAVANATPTLWGIDEDDGQLFTIEDYDGTPVFTDYGELDYDDNGTIRTIGNDIEAMTLAPDGTMFMALDDSLGGFDLPVLLSFNINDATTTGDNVVNILGSIGTDIFNSGGGIFNSNDKVTGLSIDPLTGSLYGLIRDTSEIDKLFFLEDPNNNPQNVQFLGELTGAGGRNESSRHSQ